MESMNFEPETTKTVEHNHKTDVLFFGSPVHVVPGLEKLRITLGKNQGEIPNGLSYIATYLQSHDISSLVIPMDPFLNEAGIQNTNEFEKTIYKILAEQISLHDPEMLAFELMYTFNSDGLQKHVGT